MPVQNVQYTSLTSQTQMALLPMPPAPFAALVIDCDGQPARVQNHLCDVLVAAGCILIAAWGPNSTTWDDAGDWAALLHPDGTLRAKALDVTTVWFDHDPYSEAAAFVSAWYLEDGQLFSQIQVYEFGQSVGRSAALAAFSEKTGA